MSSFVETLVVATLHMLHMLYSNQIQLYFLVWVDSYHSCGVILRHGLGRVPT